MTDYTPSGDPLIGSRGLSNLIRDEFNNIATAVNSKENIGAISTVSITPTAIPGSVPSNITQVWETGKSFLPGYYVSITDTALPGTNNMFGMVLSYNATSGAATVNITSKNGSGTISAWTIVTTSPSSVTLGTNMFVGAQNFARATVASAATTADIWNALGNQIDFTGTATVTGFPAAPQAGASRKLICAGACSFTAGANMLIDGVSSGNTLLCAANDIINVEAVSTTQFRLTRIRYLGKPITDVAKNTFLITTGNGHGSSSTFIRLYTTTVFNNGTAFSISHSATLGTVITINETGLYLFTAVDSRNPLGTCLFGLSINASGSELTNNVSLLALNRLVGGFLTAGTDGSISEKYLTVMDRLTAGDTIRVHDDSSNTATTARITKIFGVKVYDI